MINKEYLDDICLQMDGLRTDMLQTARSLDDFSRRLELILSQDHKNIAIRDIGFAGDFSAFCASLRQTLNSRLDYWQQAHTQLRDPIDGSDYDLALAVKGFVNRAKTLSRAEDELSTSYARFNRFYRNYTLAKLPVWLLTSCCNDLDNITGKILFLSRELSKKTESTKRGKYGR